MFNRSNCWSNFRKNERQRVSCGKFCNFCFQNSYFFPTQKWMNLISDRLSTASIKYLNWPSPVFGRFQNGCNKVVIEPRVVQFWSEIILVITNRTCSARSFDFEITHMISAQIALHSVQLPLKNEAPENITITLSACSKIKHWDTITSAVDHMIFILQKCFFHIWL